MTQCQEKKREKEWFPSHLNSDRGEDLVEIELATHQY